MYGAIPDPAAQPHAGGIHHSFAEVNGIRLHYSSAGCGKPILFLHGFPEFWRAWKNQLTEFGRDFLAVAPDLRGYNLSSKPAEVDQYQLKHLVEDVRGLSEHLGPERLIVVGHDWGGVVAWAFASQYPDYLERLIIINAPHPAVFDRELRENPAQQQASLYRLVFRSAEAEQILSSGNYSAFDQNILQPGIREGYFTDEDRRAYLDAWSQPGALTGGLNYYRAAHVGPPEDSDAGSRQLANQVGSLTVRVPTLVIWGEKDPYLLTGNLIGLDQFVPDLQVRRIADGSHWVIHEKPALVNSTMRDFIENRRESRMQEGA
jgi:epoxide hydrolase 4